jgi:hypothetical protein
MGTANRTKRGYIVGDMVIGMAAGFFGAGLTPDPTPTRAAAAAARMPARSNVSFQPVIARRGGAALVRLRF